MARCQNGFSSEASRRNGRPSRRERRFARRGNPDCSRRVKGVRCNAPIISWGAPGGSDHEEAGIFVVVHGCPRGSGSSGNFARRSRRRRRTAAQRWSGPDRFAHAGRGLRAAGHELSGLPQGDRRPGRVAMRKGWLRSINATRGPSRWLVPDDEQNITDTCGRQPFERGRQDVQARAATKSSPPLPQGFCASRRG